MPNQPLMDPPNKLMTWQDIPRLDPEVQFAKLPDGRTLVSHRGGFSVRAGCHFPDLGRVLAAVDGRRTTSEIARFLSPFYHKEDLFLFLNHLVGDVLHLGQGIKPQVEKNHEPAPFRGTAGNFSLLVIGNGFLAAEIGEGLSQCLDFKIETVKLNEVFAPSSLESFAHFTPGKARKKEAPRNRVSWDYQVSQLRESSDLKSFSTGKNLLVFALDRGTLGQWFRLQTILMELAVPGLFLIPFQGRLRWQLCLDPQVTGCLACSYLRSLRPLQLEGATLLKALEVMHTFIPVDQQELSPPTPKLLPGILSEVGEMFRAPRASLTHILEFGFDGKHREFLAKPVPGCPLCSDLTEKNKTEKVPSAVSPLRRSFWRKLTGWKKPTISPGTVEPKPFRRIAILGGGTAGYLTALALKRKFPHLPLDLIESSKVPVIGVGEATTPLMPQFLHGDLGLDVTDFFHRVKPTFKLGIHFNWGHAQGFAYPFGRNRVRESLLFGGDLSHSCLNAELMKAEKLPLVEGPKDVWESRLGPDTAYHLDNQRFVAYLRQKASARGIPVLDELVTKAKTHGETVQYLETEDGRRLDYDFYVDCSGFRALLMDGSLGSPFVDYGASLFTDRAWVAWVPNSNRARPYTQADTMTCGWCWNVPQPGEDHVGYVFCSRHCDDEEALVELRRKYPTARGFRLLKFRSGAASALPQGQRGCRGKCLWFCGTSGIHGLAHVDPANRYPA